MDKADKGRQKKAVTNIDKIIEEIRYVEGSNGRGYRKIDSIGIDKNDGVVNRVIREKLLDGCGEPINKEEEIAGRCKVCGRMVKKQNAIRCDGRCGEIMDLRCYQRQGSHVLHNRKFCRFDYWMTKYFWQLISPILKQEKREEANEGKIFFENLAARLGRKPFRDSKNPRPS